MSEWTVARGQLIAESIRIGASLRGIPMRLLGVTRVVPAEENLSARQPRVWTFIGFEVDDAAAEAVAGALGDVLEEDGGWYCNFSTAEEMWVVFAGASFRYPLGDAEARAVVVEYARRHGVPEPQLDWER